MAKKVYSVWRLLLGSFITLLGFAACKTAKQTQPEVDIRELYGPPPVKVEKQKPAEEMKLLYGAPPVRVVKVPE